MNDRLVSIVIPTYNCAHLLPRALQSVIDQTYPHWEVIVIDNHSCDNTREIVLGFEDSRIRLLHIHNSGVIAVSRNLGIQHATGRWIAFLDADDWWTPEKLAVSVKALAEGNDLVYHDLLCRGPGSRMLWRRRIKTRALHSPVFNDLLLRGNALTNSSVVVCRKILVEAGCLSENPLLVAAEDFECWIRISFKTEKFKRLPNAHGYYWIGGGNVSSPSRTITCLGELRRLYWPIDSAQGPINTAPWLSFALGKAYFQQRQYTSALDEFSRVSPFSKNSIVFLKAAFLKQAAQLLSRLFSHESS